MLISKDWKIESEGLNVVLLERKVSKATPDKPSCEYWRAVGYYSTVQNALHGLIDFEVRGTGLKDFKTVIAKVEELHKKIDQIKI